MPKLSSGLERLESLLYSNIGDATSELESTALESLEKPKLTGAFGDASALCKSISIISHIPNNTNYSLSIGGAGSLSSYTLDSSELEEDLKDIKPEDDFEIGANIQLLNTSLTLPLEYITPRLAVFTSFSYLDFEYENYYFESLNGTLALSYSVFRSLSPIKYIEWKPITLTGGLSYGRSRLGTKIEAGVISESFDLDPDGDGPLLSQSVEVEVEPTVDIGFNVDSGILIANAATGFTFLDSIHLYFGGGVNLVFGKTEFTINSSSDIRVLGYLSELIEEPGSVIVTGSIDGNSPDLYANYIFSTIQFDISTLFINLSVLYQPSRGISAGISFGALF